MNDIKLVIDLIGLMIVLGGGFVAYGRLSKGQDVLSDAVEKANKAITEQSNRIDRIADSMRDSVQKLERATNSLDTATKLQEKSMEFLAQATQASITRMQTDMDELRGDNKRQARLIHELSEKVTELRAGK